MFPILFVSYFFNNFFFTDSFTRMSYLDLYLLVDSNELVKSQKLYYSFIFDLSFLFQIKLYHINFLFYQDYQDYLTTISFFSPELTIVLGDYIQEYFVNTSFGESEYAVYDLFSDNLNADLTEYTSYLILFVVYV